MKTENIIQNLPQVIALPELAPRTGDGPAIPTALEALHSVKVQFDVILGEIHSSLGELTSLKAGATLAVQRALDEPVELKVGGALFARGTLVAVGDTFGIRITEMATVTA